MNFRTLRKWSAITSQRGFLGSPYQNERSDTGATKTRRSANSHGEGTAFRRRSRRYAQRATRAGIASLHLGGPRLAG